MRSTKSDYIKSLIKNDSGFSLLNATSAHLIISFLYSVFRLNHIQALPSDEIETKLATFLQEHIDEIQSEEVGFQDLQAKARDYISEWCGQKQYLRRYYNKSSIPLVELSAGVERVFNWIENCEPKEFVGTQSRFQTILLQLRELNQNINTDPETRIQKLKEQRAEIDREIKEIQKTGIVKTYTKIEIAEWIGEIDRNSRELLSDFRQVEANFRSIMQEIYKKQSETENTRGNILGYTLDTDRKLRLSPQGQSFSSFWNFLSQDTNNEISSVTESIISNSAEKDEFLLNLKNYLYEAGHKIIEQNRTLTDRINRILQQQTATERKQFSNLTSDIKKEMHKFVSKVVENKNFESEIGTKDFMKVETKPNLFFPQSRNLSLPEIEREFVSVQHFDQENSSSMDSALNDLLSQFYVDEKLLLKQIEDYRKNHNIENGKTFTLKDVIQEYPIQKGLEELLTWFSIAQNLSGTVIVRNETDEIEVEKENEIIKIKIPKMIFS